MQLPYQNIGEATEYCAFITGADGHDKASLLRRTFSPNLPDTPVLDDDGWQRLLYLIDAAPKLLELAKRALPWLEVDRENDLLAGTHDQDILDGLIADARTAIDLATKGKP